MGISDILAAELARLAREREIVTGARPSTVALLPALTARCADAVWRLISARWYLRRCTQVGSMCRTRGRPSIEGAGVIRLGRGVRIWSHLARTQLSSGPGAELIIGDDTFVNVGTSISARALVRIGKRCQIANHVVITDSSFHGIEDRDRPPPPQPITVHDDAWIAVRAILLPGAVIGAGSVVAAGAVVTGTVPPNTLVAGVPARPVRSWAPKNPRTQAGPEGAHDQDRRGSRTAE